MRKLKRSVAKARLAVLGVGNINRKLRNVKDGLPLWRVVTEGESGKEAAQAQFLNGQKIKAAKKAKEAKAKRKIRKIVRSEA